MEICNDTTQIKPVSDLAEPAWLRYEYDIEKELREVY